MVVTCYKWIFDEWYIRSSYSLHPVSFYQHALTSFSPLSFLFYLSSFYSLLYNCHFSVCRALNTSMNLSNIISVQVGRGQRLFENQSLVDLTFTVSACTIHSLPVVCRTCCKYTSASLYLYTHIMVYVLYIYYVPNVHEHYVHTYCMYTKDTPVCA